VKHRTIYLGVIVLLVLLVTVGVALAGVTAGYNLDWWTSDGGGGTSSGGSYNLSGTIGQPDAGVMTGGSYRLEGGFWGGAGAAGQKLYLPLVMK
jgi:hypothetical protein